jgi:hypothetical protein
MSINRGEDGEDQPHDFHYAVLELAPGREFGLDDVPEHLWMDRTIRPLKDKPQGERVSQKGWKRRPRKKSVEMVPFVPKRAAKGEKYAAFEQWAEESVLVETMVADERSEPEKAAYQHASDSANMSIRASREKQVKRSKKSYSLAQVFDTWDRQKEKFR